MSVERSSLSTATYTMSTYEAPVTISSSSLPRIRLQKACAHRIALLFQDCIDGQHGSFVGHMSDILQAAVEDTAQLSIAAHCCEALNCSVKRCVGWTPQHALCIFNLTLD